MLALLTLTSLMLAQAAPPIAPVSQSVAEEAPALPPPPTAAAKPTPSQGATALPALPTAPASQPASDQAPELPAPPAAALPTQPTDLPQAPSPSQDPMALLAQAMDNSAAPLDRSAALESLAQARDTRLVPTYKYLMRDAESGVRRSAARALGAVNTEGAQAALLAAIRDPMLLNDVREECLRQLASQPLETSAARVEEVAADASLPIHLVTLARAELVNRFPGRLTEAPPQPATMRRARVSGRGLLTAGGAIYGGYSLWGIGRLGQSDSGPAIGLLGGAALGGAAGLLLGDRYTSEHALTLVTGTGLGLWLGVGLAYGLVDLDPESTSIHLFSIGGELVGLAATELLWSSLRERLEVPDDERRGGENGLAAGTAVLGAVGVHLLSNLGGDDNLTGWAVASGAILGGATGNLLGRRLTPPYGELLSTGAIWGLIDGALLATALSPESPHSRDIEGFAFLGGALGMAAAGLTFHPDFTSGDIATINLMGALGLAMGAGIANLPEPKGDNRPALGLMAGTSLAGLGAGLLLTRQLEFTPGDRALVALGATHGFFSGMSLPGAFSPEPKSRHRTAGMLLGASLGALGAGAIAQSTDLSSPEVGALFLVDGLGSLGGLGIGMLAANSEDSTAINAGFLVGGALGLAVGSQLVTGLSPNAGDYTLTSLATALGAFHGASISLFAESNNRQVVGATLLGGAALGLSGLTLASKTELSTPTVLAAGSGGLWGLWLSLSALSLKEEHPRGDVLVVLAATDAGLAATSLLLSAGVSPRQVGIASLGGLGGAVLGTLLVALSTQDSNEMLIGNIIGTGVGLVGGAIVASLEGPEQTPEPSATTSHGRWPLVAFQGVTTQPVLGRDGRVDGFSVGVLLQNQ